MSKTNARELKNISEMKTFASEIAQNLLQKNTERCLILLDGPMGAGKTEFTRAFLEALGSQEASSPSFAVHNSYVTSRGSVEHLDLFRLESAEDLESVGFWDFFLGRKGIVIIEWAQRLSDWGLVHQLPRTWPKIQIEFEIPEEGKDKRLARIS